MKIFRSVAVISSFIFLSRILGLIRDQLMAAVLGAGSVNDAFIVALRFPNLFRRWFAEGAFSAAFIPMYSRKLEGEGKEKADQFSSEIFSFLTLSVSLIVILSMLFMPWLMYLISPGYANYPGKFELAILYTQITMPYLLFMSLLSLFGGILNARGYFAVAAAAPILLNVFLIICFFFVRDMVDKNIGLYLSIAVTVSGVFKVFLVFWACKRAGVQLCWKFPKLTSSVKQLLILSIPAAFSAGITQINLLVSNAIASVENGAQSWLFYADRLYQLPLGLIGVALGVVLLPALSKRIRVKDYKTAHHYLNRASELALFLTLPATMALVFGADFFVQGLFQHGEFSNLDTYKTYSAVIAFALGLPAFVSIKVYTPAFFAEENTKTPMQCALISMIVNIVVALLLFPGYSVVGLALATSIAGWVNMILILFFLIKNHQYRPDRRFYQKLPIMFINALFLGGVILGIKQYMKAYLGESIIQDLWMMCLAVFIGASFYFFISFISKSFSVEDIRRAVKK